MDLTRTPPPVALLAPEAATTVAARTSPCSKGPAFDARRQPVLQRHLRQPHLSDDRRTATSRSSAPTAAGPTAIRSTRRAG